MSIDTETLSESPDVESVIEAPASEPKSMDDTIRETYRELTSKGETIADDDVEAEPVSKESRARGPDGKFVAKEVAPPEAASLDVQQQQPAAQAPQQPAQQQSQQRSPDNYPTTWKKGMEQDWAKMPPALREEIHRREQNFLDGVREYKEPAAFGRAIGQEMLPHIDVMRHVGVTPQQLTKDLMGTWSALVSGTPEQKKNVLLQVAQQYGIDISAQSAPAITSQPAEQPMSPDLSPVLQRVQSVEQLVKEQAANQARLVAEQANGEVSRFAARQDRPHFKAVQETMASLVGSGQANSLDEAYDKAIWLVPEVRELVLAEQAKQRSAEEAAQAAAARKAAAVNVTRRGTPPVAQKTGSMEDTIRATLRQINAQ